MPPAIVVGFIAMLTILLTLQVFFTFDASWTRILFGSWPRCLLTLSLSQHPLPHTVSLPASLKVSIDVQWFFADRQVSWPSCASKCEERAPQGIRPPHPLITLGFDSHLMVGESLTHGSFHLQGQEQCVGDSFPRHHSRVFLPLDLS